MEGKFALRDFQGKPLSYWFARPVDVPKMSVEKEVGHHIVIVDRSGSMWGAMEDTKLMIEKVMTVEEFHDANLLLSLISYSSSGDVTTHFQRVPVKDVNRPGSGYIEELRRIRASCLTCASQALDEAVKLVGTETTAISLHTDGWFNDNSPAVEKKEINKILKGLSKQANVFVNTIAYSNYSDFNYLSQIANQMSGSAVLAKDVKSVFTALHDTTALLAGRVTPALPLGIEGADWQLAMNLSKKKVNGASADIIVRGAEEGDDLRIYRFSKITESTYSRSNFPELDRSDEGVRALAAFARTKLAEGEINEAKYTLVTMRVPDLLKKHFNALSSNRLAALSLDLDEVIHASDLSAVLSGQRSTEYGLSLKQDLKSLFLLLNRNTDGFSVHMPKFLVGYQRRSVVRLEGKFQENGLFTPNPILLTEETPYEEDPLVQVTQFSANIAQATVNMSITRPAVLMRDTQKISRVAGKKLDLALIRSYTVIGDGEVLVKSLPLSINDKQLLQQLIHQGYVSEGVKINEVVEIELDQFPIVPMVAEKQVAPTAEEMNKYAQLLVQAKLYAAVIPAESKGKQEWTTEQVEELRAHCLSPNLVYSAPTTNPYQDIKQAATDGLIDSYTRYNVSFGNALATDLRSSLWSANEYLARRFSLKLASVTDVDKEGFIKKPKFEHVMQGAEISTKVLSARTKLTPLDDLVMPVFEKFLAEYPSLSLEQIKTRQKEIDVEIDAYEKFFSDLAMVLGSTGLIPSNWEAQILPAAALQERHPDIDMPSAHANGTFFGVGDVYIGIHPDVAWYSTEKGAAEAEKLQSLSR